MKKVIDTKNPTVRQMISISENLREKFKKYSSVAVETHAHSNSTIEIEYRMYIEDKTSEYFETWPELLSSYHKLMKEKV